MIGSIRKMGPELAHSSEKTAASGCASIYFRDERTARGRVENKAEADTGEDTSSVVRTFLQADGASGGNSIDMSCHKFSPQPNFARSLGTAIMHQSSFRRRAKAMRWFARFPAIGKGMYSP